MSTAMSTKRLYVAEVEKKQERRSTGIALFALIVGFALVLFGAAYDLTLPAAMGSVGFLSALMYFNSSFWAKYEGNRKVNPHCSRSPRD